VRVILSELKLTRSLRNRVFRASRVSEHALILRKLSLEVEIAKVARWPISSGPRRAEPRVATPLMARSRRTNILCDRRMEVRAHLLTFSNAT
jgi:hypothetical protein